MSRLLATIGPVILSEGLLVTMLERKERNMRAIQPMQGRVRIREGKLSHQQPELSQRVMFRMVVGPVVNRVTTHVTVQIKLKRERS